MGSVFTTIPGNSIKGFMNKDYDIPFHLQFVPGYTVEVVHSNESFRYEGDNTFPLFLKYLKGEVKLQNLQRIACLDKATNDSKIYHNPPIIDSLIPILFQ